ncbi:conserved hypothetical protein [Arcobacter nitrofigilis DSM 7299]|uniref:SnoaL-like domain-containing protein n=1 Tax=Arcobacter nitrofigilis (strain ATCC 33309 / DSM 7299 / CCUG 15893 / LMG 7604 / NCTC 12251 / CI) TaxID=572480 RepID=D5UZR6_ARCNC|nr:nuclear transport factor 2 family protein [Arcobacter nitrofigilis]ADG93285.1 conserved hypothetical protein [Arcobacter nitrofigilis DSM 7299]
MNFKQHAQNYALFFENLNRDLDINDYRIIFSEDIYFEDPFQKINDLSSLIKIFNHMYETLEEPSFNVTEIITKENISYLRWIFKYKTSKISKEYELFMGVSRVEFSSKGKVVSHIDYWDSGVNIYEKVPVLKYIIKYIKNKLKA